MCSWKIETSEISLDRLDEFLKSMKRFSFIHPLWGLQLQLGCPSGQRRGGRHRGKTCIKEQRTPWAKQKSCEKCWTNCEKSCWAVSPDAAGANHFSAKNSWDALHWHLWCHQSETLVRISGDLQCLACHVWITEARPGQMPFHPEQVLGKVPGSVP